MSIRSMTGYGQGHAATQVGDVRVEVRTVNHRFAEYNIRMPREWLFFEDEVRKILGKSVLRGRVDVFIHVDHLVTEQEAVVNWPLLEQLLEAESALYGRFEREIPVDTVGSWLRHPEVVQFSQRPLQFDQVEEALREAIAEAASQLAAMRASEGLRLEQNLREKLETLSHHVEVVKVRDKSATERQIDRLRARVQALKIEVEPDRLAQEVVLLVDRAAIDEEIVRLASHIDAFEQALIHTGSVGRRLDFIVQEMHREVNTIGSKSSDTLISSAVVDMKVLVEQLREQVQNVE